MTGPSPPASPAKAGATKTPHPPINTNTPGSPGSPAGGKAAANFNDSATPAASPKKAQALNNTSNANNNATLQGTQKSALNGTAQGGDASHVVVPDPYERYQLVEGPVDQDRTLVEWDVPFAPEDPRKSLKLRQRLGLSPEQRAVDPNVRVVVDNFLPPRTWMENDVRWVQHASPYPSSRNDTVHTREKLHRLMQQMGAKPTGVCPVRSLLHAEAFLETIRQVTADCWERGLLLLKVHAERVASQKYHRELYESRTGYALRLALKGEQDVGTMIEQIAEMTKRKEALSKEEEEWKRKCESHAKYAEEQILIDEKRFSDEINALKKEAGVKKNQLDALTAPIKRF